MDQLLTDISKIQSESNSQLKVIAKYAGAGC